MSKDTTLVLLNTAHRKIQLAKTIPELKDIHDKAKALQELAKQQNLGLEIQNDIAEIRLRAERKAGELLKETELNKGGWSEKNKSCSKGELLQDSEPKLSDLGISKNQSSNWQRIASIPKRDFENKLTDTKEKDKELTTIDFVRFGKKYERKETTEIPDTPDDIYDIFYADPPWKYDFSETTSREIEQNYPTLTLSELKEIKIPANGNAVLYLWGTAPKIREALDLMDAWGFNYKTHAIWDKEKIGMGYWFRGQHELLLVGVKGDFSPPEPELRVPSVLRFTRTKHSKKPDEIRELITKWYPNHKKIELFARKQIDGWEVWGNEC